MNRAPDCAPDVTAYVSPAAGDAGRAASVPLPWVPPPAATPIAARAAAASVAVSTERPTLVLSVMSVEATLPPLPPLDPFSLYAGPTPLLVQLTSAPRSRR